MSEHRATPEQWDRIERRAKAGDSTASCICEFRDRVAALEAKDRADAEAWAAMRAAGSSTTERLAALEAQAAPAEPPAPEHALREIECDLHPEVKAAYAYVYRAIGASVGEMAGGYVWHGWALREAFLAGCSHAAKAAPAEPAEPRPVPVMPELSGSQALEIWGCHGGWDDDGYPVGIVRRIYRAGWDAAVAACREVQP